MSKSLEAIEKRLKEAETFILKISQTYENNKSISEDQPETQEGNVLLHTVMEARQYITQINNA